MSNFRNDFEAVEIGCHLWYVVEDRGDTEEGWRASEVLSRWREYIIDPSKYMSMPLRTIDDYSAASNPQSATYLQMPEEESEDKSNTNTHYPRYQHDPKKFKKDFWHFLAKLRNNIFFCK